MDVVGVRLHTHLAETLDDVIEYHQMSFTLLGHGDPSFVQTGVVSWDYFNVLGVQPILGRSFRAGEDEPGAEPLIVLSNRYWYEKFGGDPNVIGMTLQMNNAAHRVIGVLPPMPPYPMDNDIWIGASTCPFRGSDPIINTRARPFVQAYGKMKPDVTLASAETDLGSIVQRLQSQYPDAYPVEQGFSANLSPLRTEMTGDSSAIFYLLLGMTGLVLLIACANVANLNLARMATREQEFAIRESLGASPGRIAQQVLTESVLLALAGGVLGLIVAWFGIGVLADFAARYTPLASEVKMDQAVLIFSLSIALVTGLVSGSVAAFQRRNLNRSLKEGGGNITSSSSSRRLRQSLLVIQFALAFIILTSAVLVSLSLNRLSNEDPGFRTESVLSTDMTLNFSNFTTNARRQQFLRYLEDTLAAHPQINRVGASSTVPLEDTPTLASQVAAPPAKSDGDKAKADFGVETKEAEAANGEPESAKEERLRALAGAGFNPVIAVGFAYSGAVAKVAEELPDTQFAIVDDGAAQADNIANLLFAEHEGSFLVGAIAVLVVKRLLGRATPG